MFPPSLRGQCPRLYVATTDGEATLPTYSTVVEIAYLDLSTFQQSFYLKIRPKSVARKKAVPRFPVSSHAEDEDSGHGNMPVLAESSADEGGPAEEGSDDSDGEFEEARSRVGKPFSSQSQSWLQNPK